MANDYLVLKPTCRQCITVVAPNNNSAPLLDDRVFRDTDTGRTLSLSATDIIDTLSATAQVIASFNFNITDAIDTITADIENIVSSSLSVTGAIDTLESNAENIISAELSATDNRDTAEIIAQLERMLSLDVTEAKDKAVIRIDSGTKKKVPTGSPVIWNKLLQRLQQRNASFVIQESADTMQVSAIAESKMSAVINETGDGIKFISRPVIVAQVTMQEQIDTAYADAEEFRIKSDKIYSDYDADLMAIFAMAS